MDMVIENVLAGTHVTGTRHYATTWSVLCERELEMQHHVHVVVATPES
jgi:hypothetical protein